MIGGAGCALDAVNDALTGTGASFDHIPVLPGEVCAALAGAGGGAGRRRGDRGVKGEGEAGG